MKKHAPIFVYIVECADKRFYTGMSKNPAKRIREHNAGRGAKYLRARLPVKLVYCKEYRYFKNARRAERRIKRLRRYQKDEMIEIYRKQSDMAAPAVLPEAKPDAGATVFMFPQKSKEPL